MAIRFICPHCGHQIYVADDLDGRQGQCPKCGRFAMIQGQHIPDSGVPNLVNIATAPENRPSPAGPAEKTVVMQRGSAMMPSAPGRSATAVAQPPAFPPPLPVGPQGTSPGIPMIGSPLAGLASATKPGSSTRARAVSGARAPVEEEEGGVGMQKLVLSIVAGAAAAAIIGIVLVLVLGKKGAGPGPTDKGAVVKDKKAVIDDGYTGPVYNISLKGSVGVIVNVPKTASEHLDHVQKELMTFADLVADDKINVNNYIVVYPTAPGDPRDAKSGTKLSSVEFQRWLETGIHGHSGGDLPAAVQYMIEQGPDAVVLISLNPLGDAQARVEALFKSRGSMTVHGVALGSEAAKADLERLIQGGGRFRYQTLSAR